MTEMLKKEFSAQTFVKGGGAMIVGIGRGQHARRLAPVRPRCRRRPATTRSTQLDSFLTLNSDNTWTVTFGQPELGHGATTGIAMLVADELDVGMDQVGYPAPDT